MWQSTSCTISNQCDGDLVEGLVKFGQYFVEFVGAMRTNWKERCVDVAHKHPARAAPALTKLVIQIQFYDDCINKGRLRFLVPSASSSFLCSSLCWWLLCVYLQPVGEYLGKPVHWMEWDCFVDPFQTVTLEVQLHLHGLHRLSSYD